MKQFLFYLTVVFFIFAPEVKSDTSSTIYKVTFNSKKILMEDNNIGFFKDLSNDSFWEVIKQTENEVILFHPDGKPIKFTINGDTLTQTDLNTDEKMDVEYQLMEYTPQKPYIMLNPYGATPLSALVRFKTPTPMAVRLTIKGKEPAPDLTFDFPEQKTEHQLPVWGLFPKHTNQIELTTYTDTEKQTHTFSIKTNAAERDALYIVKEKKDNENLFYYCYSGIIYDEYGFIRYHIKLRGMPYLYPSELITEERYFGLRRYNLLGKKLQEYPYPSGFSSFTHGIGRMPNGDFLVIGTQRGSKAIFNGEEQPTHRDVVLVMDYKTGQEIKRFDIAQILNPDRSVIVRTGQKDFGAADWLHMNSVQYDPSDNSIVISGRHVGMVKFDYATGALKWVFGPKLGYEKSGRDGTGPALWDKILTAVDAQGNPLPDNVQKGIEETPLFQWPTTTHDAKVWGDGIFSILNNDALAYDTRIISHKDSRGMIFKIDEKKKTIQQIWSEKTGLFSGPGSNVDIWPKTKDVSVFLAEVDEQNSNMKYGYLVRYNRQTKEKMFEAVIHRQDNSWDYRTEPIDFHGFKLTDS